MKAMKRPMPQVTAIFQACSVAEPAGVPVVVWVGLALVAAGLPIGGLLVRQRSRQRTSWTSTSPASRPTRSVR